MMEGQGHDQDDGDLHASGGTHGPTSPAISAKPKDTPATWQTAGEDASGTVQGAGEGDTEQELPMVAGLMSMWSSVATQATKLLKDVEQNKTVGRAKELSKELAHRAVEGFEHVIEALDPMGGLGSPRELKIVVMSVEPAELSAVQAAAATVFPVSDVAVSGLTVSSGVAAQPVGFATGQRGAENRLVNSKALAAGIEGYESAVLVSIESFIVEIEGNWYDLSCVILRDGAKDLSHVAFRQAVRVPSHYVEAAKAATEVSYEHRATGLQMTVGQAIHAERDSVSASDWQGVFTNGHMKKSVLLEHCVVGVMGEYLAEVRARREAPVTEQPEASAM